MGCDGESLPKEGVIYFIDLRAVRCYLCVLSELFHGEVDESFHGFYSLICFLQVKHLASSVFGFLSTITKSQMQYWEVCVWSKFSSSAARCGLLSFIF